MKVIITAAGRGIGFAIAQRFSKDGASVFIGDIDTETIQAAKITNERINGAACDFSAHDQVPGFIDHAIGQLGGVDVLVNNVGIAGSTCLIEDVSYADWDRTMQVNLGSHFYCAARVIPHMKAQKSGLILNISSIAGQFGYPYHVDYAVSKAAVIAFTKTLAMELGPHNIRANAICPCAVNGPRIETMFEKEAKITGLPLEAIRNSYQIQNSMRTFIDTDEIADLAAYLASHSARRISGQEIAVDGNAETLRPPIIESDKAEELT
jgi:NAD(P)-dependent dehydrogenase (short-subunit alcohol dehydrogenase family)